MTKAKSPPRVTRAGEATFTPRFVYGHMAEAAPLCGSEDGSALGAGLVRLKDAAIPWTVKYDEIILVLEGAFAVETEAGTLEAGPGDSIWLPAGTTLTYRAKKALLFYAIHPADWADT